MNSKMVIGIDGRCGAGKTTLANLLSDKLDAPVIHMDDFFLPLSLRTKERLEEAGGNIHYERFKEEVTKGLNMNQSMTYRAFDCKIMDYSHEILIPKAPITIVEGVYSFHPFFGNVYDYKIFCDIMKENQKARIISRNGKENYEQFEQRWIPMEEKYFDEFGIREQCDITITLSL
ncbi:MAG: uridine kinase [Lachnospiraceae bacterium]